MANTVRSSFRGDDFFCLVQTHGVPDPGLKRWRQRELMAALKRRLQEFGYLVV